MGFAVRTIRVRVRVIMNALAFGMGEGGRVAGAGVFSFPRQSIVLTLENAYVNVYVTLVVSAYANVYLTLDVHTYVNV